MSTFMLKNSAVNFTPVSNIFIDKYMGRARGEFVKVYLLILKYSISGELGVSSSIISSNLSLLESDIMNALNYWQEEGVIDLIAIDKMGNFNIKFKDLSENIEAPASNVDLLEALNQDNTKGMLKEIELLIGRPLSPKEMHTYLSWQKDFGFPSELILLLIEYCASKGKSDARYIEKVALAWHETNISTIEAAQNYITKNEDKWVKFRKILNYLGINNNEIMKPQQDLLEKWLFNYNFSLEIIFKACDICFERLNRADFKYIDGILNKWHKEGFQTKEEIEAKDILKKPYTKKDFNKDIVTSQPSNKKPLRFSNYEQRDYDYDSLEKKLLGWDDND